MNAEEYLEAVCTILGSYLDEQTGSTFEVGVMTTFDCSLRESTIVAQSHRSLDVHYAEATVTSVFPVTSAVPSESAYEVLLNEMVHEISGEESLQEALPSEDFTFKVYSDSNTEELILEVEHKKESLDVSEANEQGDDFPPSFASSSKARAVLLMPCVATILLNMLLL
ncbi:MAG: hypothetical protein SGBAC_004979 [Bacillariaceae sp.]